MGRTLTWRAREKDVFDRESGKNFKGKVLILDDCYRSIQDQAMKNNVKVKQAEIPDTLAVIGNQSFYHCTGLKNINLGEVAQIRKEAFSGCIRLKEAVFSDKLEILGKSSFAQCKRLEKVELESGRLRKLEAGTFQECESREKICLPEGMEIIEDRAFYRCVNLKEVVFPAQGLKKIGREAFYWTGMDKVEFPDSLEEIGDSAFLKSKTLEKARIPSSVKKIGKWAFHGCGRLKVLEILGEPEEIGEWIVNKSTTIRCRKGGSVEKYALDSGFAVEYL